MELAATLKQHTVPTPYMVGPVHFYSAEFDGRVALFDTGPPTPEGEARLRAAVDLRRVKYLFITHCHFDHYGLFKYILEESSADLYLPRKDAVKFQRQAERVAALASLLAEYGFSEEFVGRLREPFQRNRVLPTAFSERCRIVEESEELRQLGVEWLPCPGHCQSDLVYLLGENAITGDVLLRNTFQAPQLEIDLDDLTGRFRNYRAYCGSLANLAKLRGMRIRPGHHLYLDDVDQAILFYVQTLLRRAVNVRPLRHLSMSQLVASLFPGRMEDTFFVYLKVSEIAFMLDFLEEPELLKGALEGIGLFEEVGEAFTAATG